MDDRQQLKKDNRKLVSCEGKVGFTNLKAAKGAVRYRAKGSDIYMCKFCHQWHLGGKLGPKSHGKRPLPDLAFE